jgi:HlyD family secretion protein
VLLARAERDTAETNLQLCRIRSPIDGLVLSRATDVGQTVAASFQSPTLFTIANDLTRMQILANVDEADIGKVTADMPVQFTVEAFPGEKFLGKIREVRAAPTTVQNVVTYTAVVDAPNPERRLRQGMTASVSVSVQKREGVLRVPNAALRYRPPEDPAAPKAEEKKPPEGRRKGEGAMEAEGPGRPRKGTVHKLVDGKPEPFEVLLGLSDGRQTEVVSGLTEGEQVVVGDTSSRGAGGPPGGGMGGGRGRPF